MPPFGALRLRPRPRRPARAPCGGIGQHLFREIGFVLVVALGCHRLRLMMTQVGSSTETESALDGPGVAVARGADDARRGLPSDRPGRAAGGEAPTGRYRRAHPRTDALSPRQADRAALLLGRSSPPTRSAAVRCTRWAASRAGRRRSIARAASRTRRWSSTRAICSCRRPRATAGQPPPDPGEYRAPRAAARGRLRAHRNDGGHAGERDLALGLPLLRQLAEAARLPLVSANLRRTRRPAPVRSRLAGGGGRREGWRLRGDRAAHAPKTCGVAGGRHRRPRPRAERTRSGGVAAGARRGRRRRPPPPPQRACDPRAARSRAGHRLGGRRSRRHAPRDPREGGRGPAARGDGRGQGARPPRPARGERRPRVRG